MSTWEYDPKTGEIVGDESPLDHGYSDEQVQTAIQQLTADTNGSSVADQINKNFAYLSGPALIYEQPMNGIRGLPCPICQNEWYTRTGAFNCLTCTSCGHSNSCG